MRILYVTTVSGMMDFFIDTISELMYKGHLVDLACNYSERPVNPILINMGCKVYSIDCSRNLSIKEAVRTTMQLRQIILNGKYDVVHCHSPIASVCTRFAGRCINKRKTKIIYTAYGFHFYKGAPLKNWVLYYPLEKLCSRWTDVLITINTEDYELAKKMWAKEIAYIPGVGINVNRYKNIDRNMSIRDELDIPYDAILLLTVGDLNANKNQGLIIDSLAEIGDRNLYYILAGEGSMRKELQWKIEALGLQKQVKILGYRNDIERLYAATDIMIMPSHREGLSVSIMEAMACHIPVICSNIRGNRDLIIDKKGGILCDSHDKDDFKRSIQSLAYNKCLRLKMGRFNSHRIDSFSRENVIPKIEHYYGIG